MSHDFVVKFMPDVAASARLKELTDKFESMMEASSVMALVGAEAEEEADWVVANVKLKTQHEDLYRFYTERIWEAKTDNQARRLTEALATGRLVYMLFCQINKTRSKTKPSKKDRKVRGASTAQHGGGREAAEASNADADDLNPEKKPVTWFGLAKVGNPFPATPPKLGRIFPLVWQTQVTFATSKSQLKEQLARRPDEDKKDFKKRKKAHLGQWCYFPVLGTVCLLRISHVLIDLHETH